MSKRTDEIFEDESGLLQTLSIPASLELDGEEWCHLIHTDANFAAQVGVYLLERSKDLEMIITATENAVNEQRERADHFEKQVKYLRDTLEIQTKTYDTFEKQMETLTKNYQQISEECRQYRERNKNLWKSVETLESKCEEYLNEIKSLKSKETSYATPIQLHVPVTNNIENISYEEVNSDIISLRAFSEETSRKLEIERSQRFNLEYKLEQAEEINGDLKTHIIWLQYRLNDGEQNTEKSFSISDKMSKCKSMISLDKMITDGDLKADSEKGYTEISIGHVPETPNQLTSITKQCIDGKEPTVLVDLLKRLNNNERVHFLKSLSQNGAKEKTQCCQRCGHTTKTTPAVTLDAINTMSDRPGKTLSNYRELFAEIFEKLKISRESINEK